MEYEERYMEIARHYISKTGIAAEKYNLSFEYESHNFGNDEFKYLRVYLGNTWSVRKETARIEIYKASNYKLYFNIDYLHDSMMYKYLSDGVECFKAILDMTEKEFEVWKRLN